MKRILTSVTLLFALAFSAIAGSPIRFEANAGANVSKIMSSSLNTDAYTGFHVGVRGAYDFLSVPGLYANAGTLFSLKGGKLLINEHSYYLDFPIHLGYEYAIIPDVSVFAEAGPYVAAGLFGKVNVWDEEYWDTFSSSDGYRRFDFGAGVRAGISIKRFSVYVGYDRGLIDMAKPYDYDEYYDDGDSSDKITRSNLYFGLAFRF